MTSILKNLSSIPAGFGNESHSSQQIFRSALKALSYPGRLLELQHDASTPKGVNSVVAGMLLALLDSETSLWCTNSKSLNLATEWLNFHTDCVVLDTPEKADFLWVEHIHDLPHFETLKRGTNQYPDRSATCIIEVPKLSEKTSPFYQLKGPGIQSQENLFIQGWQQKEYLMFFDFWNTNAQHFPCGVDVYMSDSSHLLGLPRTTQLKYIEGEA
jgi:alpha-D-ribose 1-methylphosphonate 5-triphosphate synthase subunit PhnH